MTPVFDRVDESLALPQEEAMVVEQVAALARDEIAPRAEHYDATSEFPWDNI